MSNDKVVESKVRGIRRKTRRKYSAEETLPAHTSIWTGPYPGHGIISRKNRKLFVAWSKTDPVDDWERERAKQIETIQKTTTRF